MRMCSFPQIGDTAYLIHRAVIVKEVLEGFNIVKVRYLHSHHEFYIDISSIAPKPDIETNTLGIDLFVEV